MSLTTEQRDTAVANAIREIAHIATLPQITLKIIELVENPKSTAQDLHKVISNDPALCARILKVVNSAFYGLPGQIGSINRAIVMLGLNAVKNIAIAASLAKLFRGGELTPAFSARDLWHHAVSVAACTKMLSDAMKFGLGDEAFLAGLIHDIGIVVEMQFDRNKLIDLVDKVGCNAGAPVQEWLSTEDAIFGANHQNFGSALCEKWKFPKSFANVTGYHHRPLELPHASRTLTSLVYVADRITSDLKPGFRLDLFRTDMDQAILDELKLTPERLADVKNRLPEQMKSAGDLLG